MSYNVTYNHVYANIMLYQREIAYLSLLFGASTMHSWKWHLNSAKI